MAEDQRLASVSAGHLPCRDLAGADNRQRQCPRSFREPSDSASEPFWPDFTHEQTR